MTLYGLMVAGWQWLYGSASNITTDQHEQTVIALVGLTIVLLGGIFRGGNRLGRLEEKVDGISERMDRNDRQWDDRGRR